MSIENALARLIGELEQDRSLDEPRHLSQRIEALCASNIPGTQGAQEAAHPGNVGVSGRWMVAACFNLGLEFVFLHCVASFLSLRRSTRRN